MQGFRKTRCKCTQRRPCVLLLYLHSSFPALQRVTKIFPALFCLHLFKWHTEVLCNCTCSSEQSAPIFNFQSLHPSCWYMCVTRPPLQSICQRFKFVQRLEICGKLWGPPDQPLEHWSRWGLSRSLGTFLISMAVTELIRPNFSQRTGE